MIELVLGWDSVTLPVPSVPFPVVTKQTKEKKEVLILRPRAKSVESFTAEAGISDLCRFYFVLRESHIIQAGSRLAELSASTT